MKDQKKSKVELSSGSILAYEDLLNQNCINGKETVFLTQNIQSQDITGLSSRIGSWEFDFKNNKLTWSDVVYQIYEIEKDYQPTIESALNYYATESKIIISVRKKTHCFKKKREYIKLNK